MGNVQKKTTLCWTCVYPKGQINQPKLEIEVGDNIKRKAHGKEQRIGRSSARIDEKTANKDNKRTTKRKMNHNSLNIKINSKRLDNYVKRER